VDELNATIGLARAWIEDEEIRDLLATIQTRLFDLGADLATPLEGSATRAETHIQRVEPAWVEEVERAIDWAESQLEPIHNFVLPGGTPAAAALHQARTICRRAERRIVALAEEEPVNEAVVAYLNRLSDLLFVLARLTNQRAGVAEMPWHDSKRERSSDV
jgi:cob(I)alamin adenosyltransferase